MKGGFPRDLSGIRGEDTNCKSQRLRRNTAFAEFEREWSRYIRSGLAREARPLPGL
jgi:hypothetical protein